MRKILLLLLLLLLPANAQEGTNAHFVVFEVTVKKTVNLRQLCLNCSELSCHPRFSEESDRHDA